MYYVVYETQHLPSLNSSFPFIQPTDDAAIRHYMLDDATMTYDTARQHCIDRGRDLCLKSDICVNDEPILIGIQNGDQWTPVR